MNVALPFLNCAHAFGPPLSLLDAHGEVSTFRAGETFDFIYKLKSFNTSLCYIIGVGAHCTTVIDGFLLLSSGFVIGTIKCNQHKTTVLCVITTPEAHRLYMLECAQ